MKNAADPPQIHSRGFTKLDSGIVYSSVWGPEHDSVRVWVCLLAMADANGVIRASVPALAHTNYVTPERMREILDQFKSEDPQSRTSDYGGRRIEERDGCVVILNYKRYRNICQRKHGSDAEKQRAYRERKRREGNTR